MKIAHIFWSFTVGGAETMLVDIMNLQVNNNNVTLIIINDNYSNELISTLDKRINIVLIKRKVSSKNPIPFVYFNFQLLRIKTDVIHCHNYNLEKVILNRLLKKTIVTIHGFNRPITNKNKYAKVVAISRSIEKDLLDRGLTNTTLIYNGIDISKIKIKKSFNKEIQIVCIGRLEHKIKGQDILIRAFYLLYLKHEKIKLNFIGEGSSESYLKKLINKLGLEDKIFFHGNLSRNELYQKIRNFDILVQPSLHEGFGLTVVEAMIAKLPVVISKAEGLIEVTNNGEYAYISNFNSADCYCNVLKNVCSKILNDKASLIERLKQARGFAISKFSINETCQEYYKIYKSIIN